MKEKTRDNLIYLGVGLTIAAAGIFYAFYTERTTGKIQQIPGSILWGILSTPVIIGPGTILGAPSSPLAVGYIDHCCID